MELPVSLKNAYIKAAKYCAYQERAHSEVLQKLRALGLNEMERDEIMFHLIQEKYINEERYAKLFARSKFRQKSWGINKIRHALKSKGVSAKNIEIGLSEIESSDYIEELKELLLKKKSQEKEKNLFKLKNKLYAFAYRKGYESTLILSTIEEIIA